MQKEILHIRDEARKFSRKYSAEGRNALARELRTMRSSYFGTKKRISELEERIAFQRKAIEDVGRLLQSIEKEIQQHTQSFAERIKNALWLKASLRLREIYRKKEGVGERLKHEEDFLKILESFLIEEKKKHTETQHAFTESKNKIARFYQGEFEKWEAEDHRVRDIRTVVREQDTVFVHAISPEFTPMYNSVLRSCIDWKMKMKIALALEPSLSASTIDQQDALRNMWHRIGFILRGGHIEDASPRDAGTRALVGGGRTTSESRDPINERIERALKNRESHVYNEFVISNPEYAGLYIALPGDQEEKMGLTYQPLSEDIIQGVFSFGEEMGLPVFVIQNGVVHRARWNKKESRIEHGEAVSSTEILNDGRVLDAKEKDVLLDEAIEESPFQTPTIERSFLSSFYAGRLQYVRLHAPQNVSGETERNNNGKRVVLIDVPDVESLGSERIQYIIEDGIVYWQKSGRYEASPHVDSVHTGKIEEHKKKISLTLFGEEYETPHIISTTNDYLAAMETIINTFIKSEKQENTYFRGGVLYYHRTHTLIRLAYHLYGYAAEARKVGDISSAERVEELASTLVSKDQSDELLKRRIGKDGMFKITKEELVIKKKSRV